MPDKNDCRTENCARSKSQQRLFGMALACKRSDYEDCESEEIEKMAKSMNDRQLRKFAKTKHKGLPNKVRTKSGKPDMRVKQNKKLTENYVLNFDSFINELETYEFFNQLDMYKFSAQISYETKGKIGNRSNIEEKNINLKRVKALILKYNKPARGIDAKPGVDFIKGTINITNITKNQTKQYSSIYQLKDELNIKY